jgi:cytochrome P450
MIDLADRKPVGDTCPLPALPFAQPRLLDGPPQLRELQARCPVSRVRTPAGHEAWLVTRYAEVKQLFADPRLGRSHPDPASAPRYTASILNGGPALRLTYENEKAEHLRFRRLLTPFFSARRMAELRPRVEAQVDELLDALAAETPPVDLHRALSVPLPVLTICELLGVPYEDRDQFRTWTHRMAGQRDSGEASAAMGSLVGYMRDLVARKREEPGDDVISGLCAAEGGRLSDDEVAFFGASLLFAGHESTVVRIEAGILLLLAHPEARKALLRDPSLVEPAVEEVLRTSSIGEPNMLRYARADVEVAGVTIKAGDAVLLNLWAANHDESVLPDPERFDVTRRPNPHLALGYGPRFCIGAPLARIELRAVFARLFARFPTLRLAVPLDRLRLQRDVIMGGFADLPVTW